MVCLYDEQTRIWTVQVASSPVSIWFSFILFWITILNIFFIFAQFRCCFVCLFLFCPLIQLSKTFNSKELFVFLRFKDKYQIHLSISIALAIRRCGSIYLFVCDCFINKSYNQNRHLLHEFSFFVSCIQPFRPALNSSSFEAVPSQLEAERNVAFALFLSSAFSECCDLKLVFHYRGNHLTLFCSICFL